jgi:hypothetical protein
LFWTRFTGLDPVKSMEKAPAELFAKGASSEPRRAEEHSESKG